MAYICTAAICHLTWHKKTSKKAWIDLSWTPKTVAQWPWQGDFNAWAVEWGSGETKKRGQTLLEALSVLNLTLLNDGEQPTFVRSERSSTIDLTFVSSGLAKRGNCWRVMESCTLSDHLAIR